LHEAGHVFGLGDTNNPRDVMYSSYNGVRTGLSANDVALFQSLYGARQPDVYAANNSLDHAAVMKAGTIVDGDISTLNSAEYFEFKGVPSPTAGAPIYFHVKTSGISLLVPSVTVYDSHGHVLASEAAGSPLDGDLDVAVTGASPGNTYYVCVSNAVQNVFGIGSYQLSVDQNSHLPDVTAADLPTVDHHSNDSLQKATPLAPNNTGARLTYSLSAALSNPQDVDYYQVQSLARATNANNTVEMIAMVSAIDLNGLAARVDIFDSAGNPVDGQVIGNSASFFSLRVPNASPNQEYYVEVSALQPGGGSHSIGNYFLAVDFSPTATVEIDTLASGTLTPTAAEQDQTLTVAEAGATQFILSANAGNYTGAAEVQMRIIDAAGNVVFQLTALAGQPASTGVAFLSAGNYTVSYLAVSQNGSLPTNLKYKLRDEVLTENIDGTVAGSDDSDDSDPLTLADDTDTLDYVYAWVDPYYY
jgi:hypothetical protein